MLHVFLCRRMLSEPLHHKHESCGQCTPCREGKELQDVFNNTEHVLFSDFSYNQQCVWTFSAFNKLHYILYLSTYLFR